MILFTAFTHITVAFLLQSSTVSRAADISEADFETIAKSLDIEGCSHCMKDKLNSMHTHMSRRQIARIVDDIMTKSGKAPPLGDSTTNQ